MTPGWCPYTGDSGNGCHLAGPGVFSPPSVAVSQVVQGKWASEARSRPLPIALWAGVPFRYEPDDENFRAATSESTAQKLVRSRWPRPEHIPLGHSQAYLAERVDRRCGRSVPPCHAHEERPFQK